jgi:predicted CopG family antitoxin
MQTKKIRIKKETYARLVKKGKYGESIDDILTRLLDSIETKNNKAKQMTNTIMHLQTTKKQPWTPAILN